MPQQLKSLPVRAGTYRLTFKNNWGVIVARRVAEVDTIVRSPGEGFTVIGDGLWVFVGTCLSDVVVVSLDKWLADNYAVSKPKPVPIGKLKEWAENNKGPANPILTVPPKQGKIEVDVFKSAPAVKKCECGAEVADTPVHSAWCPKATI